MKKIFYLLLLFGFNVSAQTAAPDTIARMSKNQVIKIGSHTLTYSGNGTIIFDGAIVLPNISNGSSSDSVLVIQGGVIKAVSRSTIGDSSGTYTPTLTNTTNISSSSLGQATFIKVGNIVHVTIGGSFVPVSTTTASVLTFTLPFTTTDNAQAYIGSGSIAYGAGILGYFGGIVEILSSTTTGRFYFYPTVAAGSTANFSFSFDYTL